MNYTPELRYELRTLARIYRKADREGWDNLRERAYNLATRTIDEMGIPCFNQRLFLYGYGLDD
jgi:hypothetical protein